MADVDAIHQLVRVAYAKYGERMDRPPGPVTRDYSGPVSAGDVWVVGEPLCGVICLEMGDDSLLIENVAVDPAAQGNGLGRRLLEFAEAQAAQRGLPRLTLYTHEVMTENLAIYRHLGYRETGRRTDNGYRRVFMAKLLGPPSPERQQ